MHNIFDYNILHLENLSINVSAILKLIVFYIIIILFIRIIKKGIYRTKKFEIAKKYAVFSLFKDITLVISFIIGLQILGFNLSVLLAGSAALLVGVGLGLKNLFSDFISGIIILIDSSIKVNDVIEVNNLVSKVQEINLRTTTVLTRDDKYIILPNSVLTSNQLINWTHTDISSRFEITVGVDYSSDVIKVMNCLKEAAVTQEGVLKEPVPFVRFIDYGESSLLFSVYFWSEDLFRVENIKSEIRINIFKIFKSNEINIPFPQRVIHINK